MIYPQNFEQKIGFDKIRELLRARCLSPLGQERVDAMAFSDVMTTIERRLDETEEFIRIIREEDDFPDQYFFDVRPSLRRIRVEGLYLDEQEVFDLRRSLETIHGIVRFLHWEEEETGDYPYPALQALAGDVAVFPQLLGAIDRILDNYGKIKDSASAELLRIRREILSTTSGISRSLNAILRSAQSEGYVDKDVAPTMRDGRLVIPVAPGMKRKIRGIVHDESATGKTVFIEPAEVVEANNRIRELEGEERREVIRILTEFSATVRPLIPDILRSYEFLAEIDFIRAKARFAIRTHSIKPLLEDRPLIDWATAVHPLLQLSLEKHGKKVVPLDIELDEKQRILIISGPNAGGKSVCLKTVGLLQYMLQCGLLIPLHERSRTGIFGSIFIDIGDEQSIENDLSTYSSHLLNMKQTMKHCDGRSLILIDEFGSGTEPQIGGAMAEAVLKRFNDRKAFGVITTHYQNLKHFADAHEGVVNGAMLYDRHHMQALFQLQIGNPGSSFAVEIARKIGIPEEVIADASAIVGSEYINADKYLQDIVRDKRYWETKRQNIRKREKQKAEEKIARKMEQLLEKQRRREERKKQPKGETAQTVVKPRPVQPLQLGDPVRIKGQTSVGELLDISGKNATVAFGMIKTTVKLDRLERTDAPVTKTGLEKSSSFVSTSTQESVYEKKLQFKQDIDVRGMRGDEAIQAVTYFIDDAILLGVSRVRILHGTGTGILRTLIRDYLKTVPGVRHFQDEHVQFGGAGITVVDLE